MFDLNLKDIGRILLLGIMAYVILVTILRIAGKRSLAKMNAFDFVISVSVGSILATIMLDNKVSIFDGIAALSVLIALQWIFSKTSKKFETFENIVNADATLLFYNGTYYLNTLEKERIRKDEIIQAARMDGNLSMEQVQAVILESNGEMSILSKSEKNKEENIDEILS